MKDFVKNDGLRYRLVFFNTMPKSKLKTFAIAVRKVTVSEEKTILSVNAKDLWHFDRVSAYFSDASQIFPMHKISLVFFWIGRLMY